MKNFAIFIALIFCFQAVGQRKPKIKGNKNVVDVSEALPPFHAIELKDDLDITLQKASEEGYSITADDNLIDVLKFEVEDSTLVISSFYKITGKKKLDIIINYNYIDEISILEGKIDMKDMITSERLIIHASGPARLQLNASASIVEIFMEGMSSGDFNLATDSLDVKLQDKVDASIYTVGESTSVHMQNNASAKLEGTTDILYLDLLGSSNLKAEKLDADNVTATMDESPSAKIYANNDLQLSSKGSSKTYFYGEGKITLVDFLDTSQLHREK